MKKNSLEQLAVKFNRSKSRIEFSLIEEFLILDFRSVQDSDMIYLCDIIIRMNADLIFHISEQNSNSGVYRDMIFNIVSRISQSEIMLNDVTLKKYFTKFCSYADQLS